MDSFTWGSAEGQEAAVKAAFAKPMHDRFEIELAQNDFRRMLATLVAVSLGDEIPDELQEWASSFAGSMAEVAGVDWV